MARPVKADAAVTRRRILESAAALFAEQGEGGTSMRAVARRAGISQSMIHHYFDTKEKLYDACIEAMYGELAALGDELRAELAGHGSLTLAIEAVVRRCHRFARERRSAVLLVTRAVLDQGDFSPRQQALFPFLSEAAPFLAALLGRSETELRLDIYGLTFLIVRFVLVPTSELGHVLGLPPETEASEVDQAAEDYLSGLALRLLTTSGETP